MPGSVAAARAAACLAIVAAASAPPAHAATYEVLHDFSSATGDKAIGPLFTDADGAVHGLATAGGAHGGGVLWRQAGTTYTVLLDFPAVSGGWPWSLATADARSFYGVYDTGSPAGTWIWSWDAVQGLRNRLHVDGVPSELVASPDGTLYFYTAIVDPDGVLRTHLQHADLDAGTVTTLRVFDDTDGAPVLRPLHLRRGRLFGTDAIGPWALDPGTGDFQRVTSGALQAGSFGFSGRAEYGVEGVPRQPALSWYRVDARGRFRTLVPAPDWMSWRADTAMPTGTGGVLYAAAGGGRCDAGLQPFGVVVRFDPATLLTTELKSFCAGSGGLAPEGLVLQPDGGLVGVLPGMDSVLFRIQP